MTREQLEKAKRLESDIEHIKSVVEDSKKNRWITVIGARTGEIYYSPRFQNELAQWLESKKLEYEKELEEL